MTAGLIAVRLAAEVVLVLLDRQYHAALIIVVLNLIAGLVALDVGTEILYYTGDCNGGTSCGSFLRGHADLCAFGQIFRDEGLVFGQVDIILLVVHRIAGDSGRAGHREGSSFIFIHLHAAALVVGDLAAAHIELTAGSHKHAAAGVIADEAAGHFERAGRHTHTATGVAADGAAVHIERTAINIHAFAVAGDGAAVHIERIVAT